MNLILSHKAIIFVVFFIQFSFYFSAVSYSVEEVEYFKKESIHPISLNLQELKSLEKVMKDCFEGKEINFISLESAMDDRRMWFVDFDDLFNNTELLPNKLSDLYIFIQGGDNTSNLPYSIALRLSKSVNSLELKGTSERWVKANFYTLEDFLDKYEPWWGLIKNSYFIMIVSLLFGVIGGVLTMKITDANTTNEARSLISILIINIIIYIFILFLIGNDDFMPQAQIYITNHESFFNAGNITAVFAALALVISAINTILYYKKK